MTWTNLIEAGDAIRKTGAIGIVLLPLILLLLIIAIMFEAVKSLRAKRLKRFKAELLATGEPGSNCPCCGKPEIIRTILKAKATDFHHSPRGFGFRAIVEKSRLSCLNCRLEADEPEPSIKGAIRRRDSIGYRKEPS